MKKTVAENRMSEVVKLAGMSLNPSADDMQTAKRLMNSFYRLCALSYRNCDLANGHGEEVAISAYTKESEAKEDRWFKRLCKEFENFAGLTMTYGGIMPSIGTKSTTGGFSEKISRYFYD